MEARVAVSITATIRARIKGVIVSTESLATRGARASVLARRRVFRHAHKKTADGHPHSPNASSGTGSSLHHVLEVIFVGHQTLCPELLVLLSLCLLLLLLFLFEPLVVDLLLTSCP